MLLQRIYNLLFSYDKPQKFFILWNKLLSAFCNLIMPIYYQIIPIEKFQYKNIRHDVVVSLTSYPARIKEAEKSLKSLLRQTVKPRVIVLWLANSEFPEEADVPLGIRNLKEYGVEIKFCENIRSYKKIYYSAKLYNSDTIVTADDDFYYPPTWLEELLNAHEEYPDCVVCHRAHKIILDDNNEWISYGDWDWYSNGIIGPSFWLHPLTGAGTLFPANFFDETFFDRETIQYCCPTTDDFWIKMYTLRKNVKIVKVRAVSKKLITIGGSQTTSLISINQAQGNDLAFKRLLEHYSFNLGEFLVKQEGDI